MVICPLDFSWERARLSESLDMMLSLDLLWGSHISSSLPVSMMLSAHGMGVSLLVKDTIRLVVVCSRHTWILEARWGALME